MSYVYAGQWGPEALIDTIGRPYASTAYTVVLAGTSTPATLYTDRTKATPQANPGLVSSARGNGVFFADPAFYDIKVAGVTVLANVEVKPDKADIQGPIPPGTFADTPVHGTPATALVEAGIAQIRSSHLFFGSGKPWTDVMAFGARGDGGSHSLGSVYSTLASAQADYPTAQSLADEFDVVAIEKMATTTLTASTSALNSRVHQSAGNYVWNRKPVLPNSLSNFRWTGDGYWSSRNNWTGGNDDMLELVNAKGLDIEDVGFFGNSTPANRPNSIVRFHRAAGQVGSSSATECRLTRVFLGGAGSRPALRAVEFSADAGQDGNNDLAAFNDVTIYNCDVGYRFGTTNAIWHSIIGGAVYNASVAAIDNTPGANSTYGGSYMAVGTRFIGNALVFRFGNVLNGDSHLYGCKGEGNTMFISTPATLQANEGGLKIHGGFFTVGVGPGGDSTFWDSVGPALEFFDVYVVSAQVWHFPGSAPVRFFGGETSSGEWKHNCTITFVEHTENPGVTFTNLGSGVVRKYGGTTGGIVAGSGSVPNVTVFAGQAGAGATATVNGTNLAGRITINTGTGVAAGPMIQVNMPGYTFPRVMINPVSAYAQAYKSHWNVTPIGGGFQLGPDVVTTDSQVYTFDYIAISS